MLMRILEDKEEKRALFLYSIFGFAFLSSINYLTLNDYAGLNLSFIRFFLISFLLFSFAGMFYAKWHNRMHKLFKKKFNQTVVAGIFCLIMLPLALASSVLIFLYFHNIGLAVLNGVCIIFGALIVQSAVDTIVKVVRPQKEELLREKIKFKIIKE